MGTWKRKTLCPCFALRINKFEHSCLRKSESAGFVGKNSVGQFPPLSRHLVFCQASVYLISLGTIAGRSSGDGGDDDSPHSLPVSFGNLLWVNSENEGQYEFGGKCVGVGELTYTFSAPASATTPLNQEKRDSAEHVSIGLLRCCSGHEIEIIDNICTKQVVTLINDHHDAIQFIPHGVREKKSPY